MSRFRSCRVFFQWNILQVIETTNSFVGILTIVFFLNNRTFIYFTKRSVVYKLHKHFVRVISLVLYQIIRKVGQYFHLYYHYSVTFNCYFVLIRFIWSHWLKFSQQVSFIPSKFYRISIHPPPQRRWSNYCKLVTLTKNLGVFTLFILQGYYLSSTCYLYHFICIIFFYAFQSFLLRSCCSNTFNRIYRPQNYFL